MGSNELETKKSAPDVLASGALLGWTIGDAIASYSRPRYQYGLYTPGMAKG